MSCCQGNGEKWKHIGNVEEGLWTVKRHNICNEVIKLHPKCYAFKTLLLKIQQEINIDVSHVAKHGEFKTFQVLYFKHVLCLTTSYV